MTLQDDIIAINARLSIFDTEFSAYDRGQFYIEQYILTTTQAALLEGHIASFSGATGGIAFAANYLITDRSDYGVNVLYDFSDTAPAGNQIYLLSQQVAQGLGAAILANANDPNGNNGSLSIAQGIAAASQSWQNFAQTNDLGTLATYFPGNATVSLFGYVIPNPGAEAYELVQAATYGSFLFGKRLSDFQDESGNDLVGYKKVHVEIDPNDDSKNLDYVVKYNSDRTGTSNGIDFSDGVVVMMANERWGFESATPESWLWPSNWETIANLSELKEFRQQMIEGGITDFEQYFYTHFTGAAKDFWGYIESQTDTLITPSGLESIRNQFYFYDRHEIGTSGNDFIYSGKGVDQLEGLGGNDLLNGGWGDDILLGGDGNDTLIGGDGTNTLNGGGGTDTVSFATIKSNSSEGATVNIATGNGYFSITSAGSTIYEETDTLINIENVIGSNYNDTITGSNANNILDGGNGFDIYIVTLPTSENDTIIDSDGLGVIKHFVNNVLEQITGAAQRITETDWVLGNHTLRQFGNDMILDNAVLIKGFAPGQMKLGITLGNGIDLTGISVSNGTDNADPLTGTAAVNIINGLGGNDYINGAGGNDFLYGGDGYDTIFGDNGADILYTGNNKYNYLSGDGGNDVLVAEVKDQTDTPPANWVTNWGNGDALLGGGGSDIFRIMDQNQQQGIIEMYVRIADFGIGDKVDLSALTGINDISDTAMYYGTAFYNGTSSTPQGTMHNYSYGKVHFQLATKLAASVVILHQDVYGNAATSGNDTLNGTSGNDTINGLAGNDTINAGAGNDTLIGGLGNDALNGGDGDDLLDYSYLTTGGVSINMNDGTATAGAVDSDTFTSIERFTGSNQADNFVVAGNNVTVNGGGGDDMFEIAGTGQNTIYSTGVDSKVKANWTNNPQYMDMITEGGQQGFIITNGLTGANERTTKAFGVARVELGAGNDDVDLSGLLSTTALYSVDAGSGNDVINASGVTKAMNLYGGWGNDIITGGSGNDAIYGFEENDTLTGGAGRDEMQGGTGADIFDYNAITDSGIGSGNRDIIYDFSQAEGDKIDLSGFDGTFDFLGTGAFTGGSSPEVRYDLDGGNTIVKVDANHDTVTDFEIQLSGNITLTSGDWLL